MTKITKILLLILSAIFMAPLGMASHLIIYHIWLQKEGITTFDHIMF